MMTAQRFAELKKLGVECASEGEVKEFQALLEWERRSQAAFRAVQTKRRRYVNWPGPTSKGQRR